MQKKLIALAVAGLASTAAFAQTNVTVYGIADVGGVVRNGETGKTRYAIDSGVLSTSRLGFKGVEDLGNGLKALFTLEYGLSVDQNTGIGAGAAAARQQFVGLTGGFGTVVAGRLQTAGLDFTVAGSALGSSSALGATNVVAQGPTGAVGAANVINTLVGAGTLNAAGRADNAIAYVSPTFSGVTFAVNHARHVATLNAAGTGFASVGGAELAPNTGNAGESSATLVGASYENGPITAGAVYSTVDGLARDVNLDEWGVRAGYDFGVAKLQGAYQEAKVKNPGFDPKDRKFVLSVSAPVTAKIGLIGEYAKLYTNDQVANNNRSAYTLAGTYSLSKRTTAYAGVVAARLGAAAGLDTTTYAAGVRHSF